MVRILELLAKANTVVDRVTLPSISAKFVDTLITKRMKDKVRQEIFDRAKAEGDLTTKQLHALRLLTKRLVYETLPTQPTNSTSSLGHGTSAYYAKIYAEEIKVLLSKKLISIIDGPYQSRVYKVDYTNINTHTFTRSESIKCTIKTTATNKPLYLDDLEYILSNAGLKIEFK